MKKNIFALGLLNGNEGVFGFFVDHGQAAPENVEAQTEPEDDNDGCSFFRLIGRMFGY